MKKLISALTVREAHKQGKTELSAPHQQTIITAEARELADQLGVRLNEQAGEILETESTENIQIDEKTIRIIIEKVLERIPPEQRDLEVIKKAVLDVVSRY